MLRFPDVPPSPIPAGASSLMSGIASPPVENTDAATPPPSGVPNASSPVAGGHDWMDQLRLLVTAELEQLHQQVEGLRQHVQHKCGTDDVQFMIEEQLRESMALLRQELHGKSSMADTQRMLFEAVTPLRQELQTRPSLDDVRQLVREAASPLRDGAEAGRPSAEELQDLRRQLMKLVQESSSAIRQEVSVKLGSVELQQMMENRIRDAVASLRREVQDKPSTDDLRWMVENQLHESLSPICKGLSEKAAAKDIQQLVDGRITESLTALRAEFQARIGEEDVQRIVGGRIQEAVSSLRQDVHSKPGTETVRRMIDARMREAVSPICHEQVKSSTEDVQRRLEGHLREAVAPIHQEMQAKPSRDVVHHMIEDCLRETASPLMQEVQSKPSADDVRRMIEGRLRDTVSPLHEEVQSKPSTEDVQQMIDRRLRGESGTGSPPAVGAVPRRRSTGGVPSGQPDRVPSPYAGGAVVHVDTASRGPSGNDVQQLAASVAQATAALQQMQEITGADQLLGSHGSRLGQRSPPGFQRNIRGHTQAPHMQGGPMVVNKLGGFGPPAPVMAGRLFEPHCMPAAFPSGRPL
eukprot:gnl/TRDRNA2_/TRDRNA2_197417_c0_seq1.p1 gnl/TRDRNA2_/TRDRNA2_197417_c0~~gnl/TRDRNA2_/TRDRNA2_197417_c0_seq1.p1  ORF type:complete len:580 (-),score=122.58 gnl/TRDRNA2_/TRDRNA2_197417_c0_seq1:54-1793(-)